MQTALTCFPQLAQTHFVTNYSSTVVRFNGVPGMVSIVGYSRCFQPSTFPPFLLFTHHSLWTKYSKRKASEVFQNHLANLILHSSSLIISFRNHFILNLRGGGMLHSFLTLYFALFSLTSYYWAELSRCSSHDFQSPFNLQKNRDSAFNNLSQMRI